MKIYQYIAMNLQKGLNALAMANNAPIRFSVEDMYDYVEPSKSPTKICGIVSYASEDILPIAGLDALTAAATVTFTCYKEMADEVSDYVELYTQNQKGLAVKLSDYTAIPTFSTPTRSEIVMIGQIGEAIEVSFGVSYVLIKNGKLANQVNFIFDGKSLGCTNFEINKTRSYPADNQENSQIVKAEAQTQTLAFTITAILTDQFNFLEEEIMDTERLSQKHTLTINGLGANSTYIVGMQSGTIQGEMGGALVATMSFVIAREEKR